jgi:hypothetical protein
MTEVTDKYGKRVTRPDGVLQDGDSIRVRMNMMDAANPGLVAAAALADSVRRIEQFDARGHRPGFATQDAGNAGENARDARDARVRDSWRSPPPVLDGTKPAQHAAHVPPTASNAELSAARDQGVADRDRRLESAWKS